MLDMAGFVAETNATNLFAVKGDRLLTPTGDACLPGITRNTVMALAPSLGLHLEERTVSLMEFQTAEEVFTTGTMGELTPVRSIDGRPIGPRAGGSGGEDDGERFPVTRRIQEAYHCLTTDHL